MSRYLTRLREIVLAHRRALIVIAAAYAAAFLLGTLVGALAPGFGIPWFGSGLLASANAALAVLMLFPGGAALAVVGFVLARAAVSMALQITVPTLVVPFLGVVVTLAGAFSLGTSFHPEVVDVSYAISLVFDGAAFVAVGFAAWVHGRLVVSPRRFGFDRRRDAYAAGLRATAVLYVPAVLLLGIGQAALFVG